MRNSTLGMLDKARGYLALQATVRPYNAKVARYYHDLAKDWIEQARLVKASMLLAGTPSYLRVEGGYMPCIRVEGKPEVVYYHTYPHRQSASRVAQKALAKLVSGK